MQAAAPFRKTAKALLPPFVVHAYHKYVFPRRLSEGQIRKWWADLRISEAENLPADLVVMFNAYLDSDSFRTSSKYWHYLNKRNVQQLVDNGYANYRQTVATNYFTFLDGFDGLYARNLVQATKGSNAALPISEVFKKHDLFTAEQSVCYNLVTFLQYEYVKKVIGTASLSVLEEPLEGNVPFITVDGIRLSQDMLNGILEHQSISKGIGSDPVSSILEVGAGSGRTAYAMLKLMPGLRKYIIADIPPALFLSQTYLSSAFKDKRVFKFRPFESYSEIEKEFQAADLAFIMPHQLRLLPAQAVDLFLAIDCLHEMKAERVEYYFSEADRLARGFYFKCWQETVVPFDDVSHSLTSYPVRGAWKERFKENCEVPSAFFHAFYQLR